MIAALVLALASLGSAPPLELRWDAPASCPDRAAALATIDGLLGEHARREVYASITADVTIVAVKDHFRARVEFSEGHRTLEAATCREAADAALLIVAMAIDPRLGAPPDEPAPEEPTPDEPTLPEPVPVEPTHVPEPAIAPDVRTTTATRETTAIAPTQRARSKRRRPPLHALLRASAGVGYGGPPGATAVIAIGVALAGPRFRVELDGDLWTPKRDNDPDRERGISVIGWTVGVRGCGSPLARKLEIPICGGLRTGALRGKGFGVEPSPKSTQWILASAGFGIWGWIRPRFALALDVEALVPFGRPEFNLGKDEFSYTAPPAGLRAIFGPVVRLP
ncbi:MAG TPA: hypothetical protein VG755_39590 [Nannocystaceae bacterium]|nr:hypothetical protein [Nannocystaceae bacterium]